MLEYLFSLSTLEWLVAFLAIATSVWGVVKYLVGSKTIAMESIVENLSKEIGRIEKKQDECEKRSEELERKIEELHLRIWTQERLQGQIPLPHWIVDFNRVYRYVSPSALREVFALIGKSKEDVVGKTDVDIWGEEIAAKMRQADKEALLATDKRVSLPHMLLHPDLVPQTLYRYVQDSIFNDDTVMYFVACLPTSKE